MPDRLAKGMTRWTESGGIYVFAHEPRSGSWTPLGSTPGILNPSFLTQCEHVLYADYEILELNGDETGSGSVLLTAGGRSPVARCPTAWSEEVVLL